MIFSLSSTVLLHGVISAVIMAAISDRRKILQKLFAVFLSFSGLLLVFRMWQLYRPDSGFQFIDRVPWISSMGAFYHLGVDGISLSLILLTFVVVFICILSLCSMEKQSFSSACALIFFVQAMAIGAFLARDGLLFYVFWEASLIPMFLYIGICGGADRWHASKKYFLFTMFGSLFFLLSIMYLGLKAGDFSLFSFYRLPLSMGEQKALFIAFTLAFAIKLPMFPFHSWLPDAHTQASTAGSMLLAAILLKLGGYGFLRFNLPITPDASAFYAPWMVGLSLIAIIYIGLVTLVQADVKRLIAYASISHMGMITLGIFVIYLLPEVAHKSAGLLGLSGAVVHMIGHGFSSAGLFLGFGLMYRRLGSRQIADYGGMMRIMPILSCFFMLYMLSNIGFPGTAGFVGEFFIIFSTMAANFWIAACAVLTMVISAAYSLNLVRHVFYGRVTNTDALALIDIDGFEKLPLLLLAGIILFIGIYPGFILTIVEHAIHGVLQLSMYRKL